MEIQSALCIATQCYGRSKGNPEKTWLILKRGAGTMATSGNKKWNQEEKRKETFKDVKRWSKEYIGNLAKAGFVFSPQKEKADAVRCVFCNARIWYWRKNDNPMKIHKTLSPVCPFILKTDVTFQNQINPSQRCFDARCISIK